MTTVNTAKLTDQLPGALHWFALQVRARSELKVADLLQRKGYETFCPTYLESRQYSDRIHKAHRALFAGYVFISMSADSLLSVLSTPGVHAIVTQGVKPAIVPLAEIEAIQKATALAGHVKPWPYLRAGRRVKIIVGAMKGLEGVLVQERGEDRLVLSIEMLQRSVSLDVDRSWIQPV